MFWSPRFSRPPIGLFLINRHDLGLFHSPPSVVFFLSLLLCRSSSAAATADLVFIDSGCRINLIQPEENATNLRCNSASVSLFLPRHQIRIRTFEFLGVLRCSSWTLHRFHHHRHFLIFGEYKTDAVVISHPLQMQTNSFSCSEALFRTDELACITYLGLEYFSF